MFIALHHGGLPTKDAARAKAFWCGVLGFVSFPGKDNWLGWDGTTYPVHLMPPDEVEHSNLLSRHLAIEVDSLETVLSALLKAQLAPFQAALTGERRPISSLDQPLDFGIGTIFVYDPDGNVIEFVQKGRGLFALLNEPRTS
jgi:catechol 2,3-dioxygenase-like lactoylglutathione lyase family enzyme